MKDNERIDYLIKTLAGDNAKRFADACGFRTDTLSRARNGIGRASYLFTKILDTYPKVRREWLVEGIGEPFYEDMEKGEILRKVEALEKEVRRLSRLIIGLSDSSKNSSKKSKKILDESKDSLKSQNRKSLKNNEKR